jgi:hypothetical protein
MDRPILPRGIHRPPYAGPFGDPILVGISSSGSLKAEARILNRKGFALAELIIQQHLDQVDPVPHLTILP